MLNIPALQNLLLASFPSTSEDNLIKTSQLLLPTAEDLEMSRVENLQSDVLN
jgi:hypothetical protein